MAENNSEQCSIEKSMRSVFVGNIPYEITEEQLSRIFSTAGPIVSFKLVLDRENGKSKGYGFCEYNDEATANSAMRNLNGYDIDGRKLRVDNACTEKMRMEMMQMFQASVESSPYGAPCDPAQAPDVIAETVASMSPDQISTLLREMSISTRNNPEETRNMLLANPQLGYALLQALVMSRIVDSQQAKKMIFPTNQMLPVLTENPLSGSSQTATMSNIMPQQQQAAVYAQPMPVPNFSAMQPYGGIGQRATGDMDMRGFLQTPRPIGVDTSRNLDHHMRWMNPQNSVPSRAPLLTTPTTFATEPQKPAPGTFFNVMGATASVYDLSERQQQTAQPQMQNYYATNFNPTIPKPINATAGYTAASQYRPVFPFPYRSAAEPGPSQQNLATNFNMQMPGPVKPPPGFTALPETQPIFSTTVHNAAKPVPTQVQLAFNDYITMSKAPGVANQPPPTSQNPILKQFTPWSLESIFTPPVNFSHQDKVAILQQVKQLSKEQLAEFAPGQRAKILALKEELDKTTLL